MKTTLLIMAAGIGSRFGTGIKQLEPVDDAGHIIMDYSIHDAIEAGFNHVVFIIRKDIEKEFKEVIGERIASICSSHNVTVDYAFQDINDIPGTLPEGRTKPWGTGQAVLAAKKVIDTPFIVINEDDLANEQTCFYVIKQDDAYQPFSYLSVPESHIENFKLSDKDNADAILFKFSFQRDGELRQLWAYQKIQPASIPNKQKKYFQLISKSLDCPDVFKEMKDQMFIITRKIDLLILGDEIITDNIKLLERHFGLETFLRASATRAVSSITTVGLIGNDDKLQEYVQRPNKKYAKKMMQIHKFPVATMSKERLLEKLRTVERWKNVFEIQDAQVYLRTFSDVENIIDFNDDGSHPNEAGSNLAAETIAEVILKDANA